jgi:hypothetical protein
MVNNFITKMKKAPTGAGAGLKSAVISGRQPN